jgi:putative ABC transport system permease protein
MSSMPLSIPPSIDTVQVAAVSQAFFRVTGVHVVLGRLLIEGDFKSETQTAVISNSLWQRRFGSDASVIGRQIQVGGQTATVVGVTPENFDVPSGAAIWLPRR